MDTPITPYGRRPVRRGRAARTPLADHLGGKAAGDAAARAVPITPAVIGSEQDVSDAFTKAGLIPVHVTFGDYVVTSFNDAAGASS